MLVNSGTWLVLKDILSNRILRTVDWSICHVETNEYNNELDIIKSTLAWTLDRNNLEMKYFIWNSEIKTDQIGRWYYNSANEVYLFSNSS